MKKRINVKAVGIILATTALFGTGVHFLHGYQVRSNAGILLAQADRAEADGRRDNTANYLRRYNSLVPADTHARARFGLLLAHKEVAKTPRMLLHAYQVLSQ